MQTYSAAALTDLCVTPIDFLNAYCLDRFRLWWLLPTEAPLLFHLRLKVSKTTVKCYLTYKLSEIIQTLEEREIKTNKKRPLSHKKNLTIA